MVANEPSTKLLAWGGPDHPVFRRPRDKPSRPGRAGQDRSSGGSLHRDRLGLTRSLTGGLTADGMISMTGMRGSQGNPRSTTASSGYPDAQVRAHDRRSASVSHHQLTRARTAATSQNPYHNAITRPVESCHMMHLMQLCRFRPVSRRRAGARRSPARVRCRPHG
jgi:hypothetical protein